MSLLVLLEIEAKEGKADEMIDLLRVSLRDTRARQGCLSVTVHRDQSNADLVLLVEQWATREDDDAYRAWRAGEGATPAIGALVAKAPVVRYFDNVDA